jgi:hypothetical protein
LSGNTDSREKGTERDRLVPPAKSPKNLQKCYENQLRQEMRKEIKKEIKIEKRLDGQRFEI